MEHKAFDDINRAVAQDTLLTYTDSNKRFDINADAINYQLGAVVIQYGKIIAFYSHKLKRPQTRYTVTEQ